MTDQRQTVFRPPWADDHQVAQVFAVLEAAGHDVRVVGGAVRNALLGLDPKDIDFGTSADPATVTELFRAAGMKTVPTGIDHGTVTLVADGRSFEITTLRRDVETDGRHATVAFTDDWREDAARRDFTINALSCDREGNLHDYFGGLADLAKRQVRFIGEADERIGEDYLRVLRFFRFFAWYGEGRPDGAGLKACARARDHLDRLSAERVWSEMRTLLAASDPARALLWMRQTGVLTAVLPESEKWGIDGIHRLVAAEAPFGWAPDAVLRLMVIIPPQRERIDTLVARWKLPNSVARRLAAWADQGDIAPATDERTFKTMLWRADRQAVADRLKLAIAEARSRAEQDMAAMKQVAELNALLALAQTWQAPEFPLAGQDLLDAGMEPGPGLGAALQRAQQHWLDNHFAPDRDALLKIALAPGA